MCVHGKPVSGHFPVQILIAHRGLFEAGSQGFGTLVGHEVLHRVVDEVAALAGSGHPINGLDGGLRQHNVDAFAHEE